MKRGQNEKIIKKTANLYCSFFIIPIIPHRITKNI